MRIFIKLIFLNSLSFILTFFMGKFILIVVMVFANSTLETDNKFWLFICGFFSGVLGRAYGLNGPSLVIYGNMRNWTAKHFRATLQAYFLPASILGMIGYWYKGLWISTVTYYFLISIPVIFPAILLGRYFNHRLNDGTFLRYVYFGLIGGGIV